MSRLVPEWSTSLNYSAGPDTATPTKVDPASTANGFISGVIAAPQHVNFLLNEIKEHQRSLIYDPELYAEVRDDFMPGWYDPDDGFTGGLLHTEYVWAISENPTATQGPVTAVSFADDNPGVHQVTIPATESYEMHLGAEVALGLVKWGDLEEMTIVISLFSSNFTGHEMFVGLASKLSDAGVSFDAVGLWFKKALSNNWLIRHKRASVEDSTTSALVMTANEFVVMKVERISATQVRVKLNGTLVATLTDGGPAPDDSAYLNLGMVATAGASASLSVSWDLVHVRWSTPDRAT
jgi:hypothetical protein